MPTTPENVDFWRNFVTHRHKVVPNLPTGIRSTEFYLILCWIPDNMPYMSESIKQWQVVMYSGNKVFLSDLFLRIWRLCKYHPTYQSRLETTTDRIWMVSAIRIYRSGIIYMILSILTSTKPTQVATSLFQVNFIATVADDYETFWWNIPVIDVQNDIR